MRRILFDEIRDLEARVLSCRKSGHKLRTHNITTELLFGWRCHDCDVFLCLSHVPSPVLRSKDSPL